MHAAFIAKRFDGRRRSTSVTCRAHFASVRCR
jgi:hypothetical protein